MAKSLREQCRPAWIGLESAGEVARLAVPPDTGNYHHAMASNYNHVTRPPVIAVRAGRAWPLIRRETGEDLLRRDAGWTTPGMLAGAGKRKRTRGCSGSR